MDDLVNIFLACNVEEMLKNYGKSTKTEDPIIHFYEDFLSEYDPKLRKARGVWYTPEPVVDFIVRAVDEATREDPRGDILVFLPGERDIRDVQQALTDHLGPRALTDPSARTTDVTVG